MARRAGPKQGSEAATEPGTGLPADAGETPAGTSAAPQSPDLEPGEPSWPEDPDALRVEAVSEEGAAAVQPEAVPPETPDAALNRPEEPSDESFAMDQPVVDPEPVVVTEDRESAAPDLLSAPDPVATAGSFGNDEVDRADLPEQSPNEPVPADTFAAPTFADPPASPRTEPSFAGASHAPADAPRRKGGTGALLLGGMIAAALGFGAAWLAQDRLGLGSARLPADLEQRLEALEARPLAEEVELAPLSEGLEGVAARVAALEDAPPAEAAPPVDLEPLREEVAAGLSGLEDHIAALEDRVGALEARPVPPAQPAVRAPAAPVQENSVSAIPSPAPEEVASLAPRLGEVEASLSEAQAALSEVRSALSGLGDRVGTNETALSTLDARLGEAEVALAEAESRLGGTEARLGEVEAASAAAAEEARAAAATLEEARSRAEAAEAQARREASLATLDAALDSGEPFDAALAGLGAETPEPLARAATEGLPSLSALRESFSEAARAGLAAARSEGLVEEGGFGGFLRSQLSVRSTAPREGEDPDAVLSRAEAALASGRLDQTLAEIERLPEAVRSAMADWIVQARALAEAEAALAALRSEEPVPAPAD